MTREQHLLICLMEECNEVSQRISKALRFGLDEIQEGQQWSNRTRVADELKDLWAVFNILESEGTLINLDFDEETIRNKRIRFNKYLEISKANGTFTEQ